MSHLRNIKIKFANATEMKAVRAVLVEFGYPIYTGYETATETQGYNCAQVENYRQPTTVARAKVDADHEPATVLTLEQFIARQAIPLQTPTQVELAKLEVQADVLNVQAKALNDQIAALKATI
ncbi:hypothetical protein phiK7A1_135 [Pseudomonas phage phiK7A1]|uniref:Uncharacterized protein n=1 Tax=Pseudomonas phage phiK7A1 TaxID=2759194 RepID=A0A7H0XFY3_9CAUD|nr:hypothetical protein phiK7A1_135 [Pseudomonas phage phiK7A1]